MSAGDIAIFDLGSRRMAWLDQRQALLAQNVANANTPGYQPRDAAPFAAELSRQTGSLGLAVSSPAHLSAQPSPLAASVARGKERSPDGNTVSMDDQLMKVAQTSGDQALASNLLRKYQGLFRIALGRA